MTSGQAQNLAAAYLDRHIVSPDQIGLGPYLESGEWNLYAVVPDGSLVIPSNEGHQDCLSITRAVYADILVNNPELNPRIMISIPRIHYWVEITDPSTGELIQIDASPWYRALNPGHEGILCPATFDPIYVLHFEKTVGVLFSVQDFGDQFFDSYLYGYMPKAAGLMTRDKNASSYPEYTFLLKIVLEDHFGGVSQTAINLYLQVPNSGSLIQAFDTRKV